MDVIQTLSRKGIYVTDPHESAVTDVLLEQKDPFKLNCHLSLIEALMTAWTNELVSVERVVQAVRKFSSFNASSELPFDTEDALLFWVNKVCGTVRHRIGKGELIVPEPQHVMVPVMDDLLKDLSDGCCLCVLISFYCPNTVRLQDIALKEPLGIADSLYNLELLRVFCERYVPEKCHHLSVNDVFHSATDLKPSFVVLLAELFDWLEVKTLPVCVSVKKAAQSKPVTEAEDRPTTAKKLTSPSVGSVPISNVTKRSFKLNTPLPTPDAQLTTGYSSSAPDLQKASIPPPHQPLLPKRVQQRHMDNSPGNTSQSVQAWEEPESKQRQPYSSTQSQLTNVTKLSCLSSNSSGPLLSNVSMDSELSLDFSDTSINVSEFEQTPHFSPIGPIQKSKAGAIGPLSQRADSQRANPGHPDHLELQSVTSVSSGGSASPYIVKNPRGGNPQSVMNSLQPHETNPNEVSGETGGLPLVKNPHGGTTVVGNLHGGNPHGGNPHGGNPNSDKPQSGEHKASEKSSTGDAGGRNSQVQDGGQVIEKLMPAQIRPAKEKLSNSDTKQVESGEALEKTSPSSPTKQPPKSLNVGAQMNSIVMGGNESDGSTPDEDYQTPSTETMPLPGEPSGGSRDRIDGATSQSSLSQSRSDGPKPRQFEAFYVDPDSNISRNIPLGQRARSAASGTPVMESFTVQDQHHTAESARAAGLPVVDQSVGQRVGEVSSGESSDQELQKLRADHQTRETEASPKPVLHRGTESAVGKPTSDESISRDEKSLKTSFALIKQEKDTGEKSFVGLASKGREVDLSLKSRFQKGKTGARVPKKTTFAALPNQTTWQENAVLVSRQRDSNRSGQDEDSSPTSSELIDIKMRLEERRRQIEKEKRRMEMQWTKQRQRLGKQAFIQVISRGKSESDLSQVKDELPSGGAKLVDADSRLSDLIKSQTGKSAQKAVEQAPPDLKGSSAPASREQSLDRKQAVPSAVTDKLRKVAPVESPKIERSPVTRAPHEKMTHSADSARELFLEDEPVLSRLPASPTKSRPKSYHAPEHARASPTTSAMSSKIEAKPVKSSLGNYSSSLDRLNCSLSELQGEIMRLSLQQDQIKSMVVHEREPAKTSPSPKPAKTPPSQDDKYYLYPRNVVGEPDVVSAKTEDNQTAPSAAPVTQQQSSSVSAVQPLYAPVQQPTQLTNVQYGGQPHAPYDTMPSYPTHYPSYVGNQPQPTGLYSMPQQYTGMPQPHYQPANVYQPPQMYQQQMPGYGGMPQSQWHPGMAPISHPGHPVPPSGQTPYSNSTFQQALQPHGMSSTHGHIQTAVETPDLSPDHPYKPHLEYGVAAAGTPGHGAPGEMSPHAQTHTGPLGLQGARSVTPVQSPGLPAPTSSSPLVQASFSTTEHPDNDLEHSAGDVQSEKFFVGLDEEESSLRAKPVMGGGKDHRELAAADKRPAELPTSRSPVQQYVDMSPVGFVVGQEEVEVSPEMSEMEKKRQRLLELQMKRREEQERKRWKKEQEMAKKREEQQAKQEQIERKKAEERMRREAIFQEYLKRKEQDSADDEPKAAPGPQKRASSKTRSKAARPKSQPPAAGVEDVNSALVSSTLSEPAAPPGPSDGPQDDPTKAAAAAELGGKRTGHVMTFPVAPSNGNGDASQADTNYQQLAFGGLTHRRPPTPERPTRLFPDNNSDSGSIPSSSDYTGPKLFKKPSQKSNRHIIINAISHCCLAGTVNTAVKVKVLDIISKSDAKHFVILFRDAGQQFKALYTYDPEREEVLRIHGVGPKQLLDDMMERFYKYNSGAKSFTEVTSTKHLSATIDAVVIHNQLWQKKATTTKRLPNQY